MRGKLEKITLPVFVGIASFYISAIFLFGVLAGYVLTRYFSGKVGSIRFSFGGYRIHLHHWLCSSFGLTILLLTGLYQSLPVVVLGFGGGVVFEGIYHYNDWYKIVYKAK